MTKVTTIARSVPGEDELETEPPRRRGRPVGDHDAKRRELLHAAIEVLAEEGYAGISLRKVAVKAGHTTGAVTYYFANKDAMITAVVHHLFDQFDRVLSTSDGLEDIRKRFGRLLEQSSNSIGWLAGFQLLTAARHEPAFAAIYQERYEDYRLKTAQTLRRLQRSGEVRDDISAHFLADYLGAIGDGWMMMKPIETERFSPARARDLLNSLMLLLQRPSVAAKRRRPPKTVSSEAA